jgi:hypothetical protein
MRRLSGPISLRALSIAAATALCVGCSGGSAIAPNSASPQLASRSPEGNVLSGGNPFGPLKIDYGAGHNFTSFFACPATGSIAYAADYYNRVVNVYAGRFLGQAPCGQIASGVFRTPYGLYVDPDTHDLYAANIFGNNILVFHRGQTTPYNTYTDPTGQYPQDVVVAKDGTIIASNNTAIDPHEGGSLSTWIGGPNGGTFVGNFQMPGGSFGGFLTVRRNGTVYFDLGLSNASVWYVSCPAGFCGPQNQVAGVSLYRASGLAVNDEGDLLASDRSPGLGKTFELPNPVPKTFPLYGYPQGMAIDNLHHHWFVADQNDIASEYAYPSGKVLGSVVVNPPNAWVWGVAVDP